MHVGTHVDPRRKRRFLLCSLHSFSLFQVPPLTTLLSLSLSLECLYHSVLA